MYKNLAELMEGYKEIPADEKSDFETYIEQMIENDLYDGPSLTSTEVAEASQRLN